MNQKTQSERWASRLSALEAYASANGTPDVPTGYVFTTQYGSINLGSWVSYLRTRHKAGKLSLDQIADLENIKGWRWGPLRPGPKVNYGRDSQMRQMRENGASLAEIGETFEISRQRVHQILNRLNRH